MFLYHFRQHRKDGFTVEMIKQPTRKLTYDVVAIKQNQTGPDVVSVTTSGSLLESSGAHQIEKYCFRIVESPITVR